jgi:glycosyltransferase involved in cell wall biosynthesis
MEIAMLDDAPTTGIIHAVEARGAGGSLRVLHVHKDFEPLGGGGVARHIHGLAVALAEDGLAVRVVSPRSATLASPYDIASAAWFALCKHVAWADVVHIHGARVTYSAWAAALAWAQRKRVVYTPHCYYDHGNAFMRARKRLWDQSVERSLLTRSETVVLLDERWRDYLIARGLPVPRYRVVPNSVSKKELLEKTLGGPAARLSGAPALLFIGRLDPIKRIEDAIGALTRPRLSTAHLHCVGKGPDRERLEALAKTLAVEERVIFHGFVEDVESASMMRGADLFVLPSAREGLPTVLLEAMLLGVPAVASHIPGNAAVMTPLGLDAAMYPLADIDALARLITDRAGRPLPSGVIAGLDEKFTWESNAPIIKALYGAGSR